MQEKEMTNQGEAPEHGQPVTLQGKVLGFQVQSAGVGVTGAQKWCVTSQAFDTEKEAEAALCDLFAQVRDAKQGKAVAEVANRHDWNDVSEERARLMKELSGIETAILGLSPPNFKGQGEPVSLLEKVEWLVAKYRKASVEKPIPMVLFCPNCGNQHIDQPKPEIGWEDPSHKSHECQFCLNEDGEPFVWRPADALTTGVAQTKTKGKKDQSAKPRFVFAFPKRKGGMG